VGEALRILEDQHGIKREDLFLQTKYVHYLLYRPRTALRSSARFTPIDGHDLTKPIPYNPAAPVPTQITASFDVSLKNLRTTYIDSYLLHSPLATLAQTLSAWRSLCGLQDEGKVRQIGVSNVYDKGVLKALGEERKVDVVQNRWYEGNRWDMEILEYCRDNGTQYQLRLALFSHVGVY
jgi:diketogulonate reductase-like aldo/keto reductase